VRTHGTQIVPVQADRGTHIFLYPKFDFMVSITAETKGNNSLATFVVGLSTLVPFAQPGYAITARGAHVEHRSFQCMHSAQLGGAKTAETMAEGVLVAVGRAP
jgi:hypothetical protein